MNYYNEWDPQAAAWLRGLIAEGLIPPGEVDQRSITDVTPSDLSGFTQCHFFAGIGGWPLALQLAGWSADRPVWTGSCPCQPFSAAGKRQGADDERHLWPAFARLIDECRPPAVFGEQVASADGRQWLAGVFADLENMGYNRAGADLCAAGVGAPHIRQRLYWVANAMQPGRAQGRAIAGSGQAAGCGGSDGLAHTDSASGPKHEHEPRNGSRWTAGPDDSAIRGGDHGRLAHGEQPGLEGHAGNGDDRNQSGRIGAEAAGSTAEGGAVGGVADSVRHRPQGGGQQGSGEGAPGVRLRSADSLTTGGLADCDRDRCDQGWAGESASRHDGADGNSPWDDSLWLLCRDGKHRRIPAEPALFPLADGLPYKLARRRSARPSILRGAGNAIVPQAAAIFIRAAAL